MDVLNRISKTELAELLGGAFISKNGAINSRKLKEYVCAVLKIDAVTYKKNRLFTAQQIDVFKKKGII